jgi:hypothetical protein
MVRIQCNTLSHSKFCCSNFRSMPDFFISCKTRMTSTASPLIFVTVLSLLILCTTWINLCSQLLITIDFCTFLMLSEIDQINQVNNTSRPCSVLQALKLKVPIKYCAATGFHKNGMELHASEDILLRFGAAWKAGSKSLSCSRPSLGFLWTSLTQACRVKPAQVAHLGCGH